MCWVYMMIAIVFALDLMKAEPVALRQPVVMHSEIYAFEV